MQTKWGCLLIPIENQVRSISSFTRLCILILVMSVILAEITPIAARSNSYLTAKVLLFGVNRPPKQIYCIS
jgi:hypothetical protein